MTLHFEGHYKMPPSSAMTLSPSSPRKLAGAALSCLNSMPSPPNPQRAPVRSVDVKDTDTDESQAKGKLGERAQLQNVTAWFETPPATPPNQSLKAASDVLELTRHGETEPTLPFKTPNTTQAETAEICIVTAETAPLPSLLRYVDNHLMRNVSLHNHPPEHSAVCKICHHVYNRAPVETTFLPLTPCGCWVHYRCFIWWTTQAHPNNDCCPLCATRLFNWEGITALTLATRTGFTLQNVKFPAYAAYTDTHTGLYIDTDLAEYTSECHFINSLIDHHFFLHLELPSKFTDGSPDLTQCYYDVLDALDKEARPRAKWLKWNSELGFLLFGMLVAIKMRGYLRERHGKIRGTEGWVEFDMGGRALQGKILEGVREEVREEMEGGQDEEMDDEDDEEELVVLN